jgi:2-dehydro-3-deoxyglucarate aldolase/4-hydroxy-2-oxoheptanedioate aldolase
MRGNPVAGRAQSRHRGEAERRLRQGGALVGIVQLLPDPTISELVLWCGHDFVLLDCEHGTIFEPAQRACLQVIGASGGLAAVRVRRGDYDGVARFLDCGAGAILMPDVTSVGEAQSFVAAARFGPDGSRSSSSASRARGYGLRRPAAESPLLFAMIESGKAVSAIRAIAATEGLSGLVIGPGDLAADLGCTEGEPTAAFREAFEAVEQAGLAAGLIVGTRPYGRTSVARLLQRGHRFVIAGSDIGTMRDGFRSAAQEKRQVTSGDPRA